MMHVVITDDDGNAIGDVATTNETLWIDLLLYVSRRWEEQSAERQGKALEAVLAGLSDA